MGTEAVGGPQRARAHPGERAQESIAVDGGRYEAGPLHSPLKSQELLERIIRTQEEDGTGRESGTASIIRVDSISEAGPL